MPQKLFLFNKADPLQPLCLIGTISKTKCFYLNLIGILEWYLKTQQKPDSTYWHLWSLKLLLKHGQDDLDNIVFEKSKIGELQHCQFYLVKIPKDVFSALDLRRLINGEQYSIRGFYGAVTWDQIIEGESNKDEPMDEYQTAKILGEIGVLVGSKSVEYTMEEYPFVRIIGKILK